MAISAQLSDCARWVTLVDERILYIRLEHTYGFMTVLAVYAPPEDKAPETKEEFYHKLESVESADTARDKAGY